MKISQSGPAFDVYARDCPTRTVLEHVTSKWGVLVLAALRERTYRFSELRRRVDGVSEKMLSQTLRALERRLTVDESGSQLGSIIVSESGYIEVPHKNKYGQDYPPVIEDRAIYPPGKNQ